MLKKSTTALIAFGPWGIFLLSLIDSAGIPIPEGTDVLVILLAVQAPSRAYLGATMAVLGSIVGNLILFLAAYRGGRRFAKRASLPGKPQRFREWFRRYGLVTVFIPALVPIPLPLKLFVISAGAMRIPLRAFLMVIVAARVPRFFGEAWLGMKLGQESTRYLRDNVWNLAAFALALLVFLYLLLKLSERLRKPATGIS